MITQDEILKICLDELLANKSLRWLFTNHVSRQVKIALENRLPTLRHYPSLATLHELRDSGSFPKDLYGESADWKQRSKIYEICLQHSRATLDQIVAGTCFQIIQDSQLPIKNKSLLSAARLNAVYGAVGVALMGYDSESLAQHARRIYDDSGNEAEFISQLQNDIRTLIQRRVSPIAGKNVWAQPWKRNRFNRSYQTNLLQVLRKKIGNDIKIYRQNLGNYYTQIACKGIQNAIHLFKEEADFIVPILEKGLKTPAFIQLYQSGEFDAYLATVPLKILSLSDHEAKHATRSPRSRHARRCFPNGAPKKKRNGGTIKIAPPPKESH